MDVLGELERAAQVSCGGDGRAGVGPTEHRRTEDAEMPLVSRWLQRELRIIMTGIGRHRIKEAFLF